MTATRAPSARRVRACLRQTLMVILINVPTVSFGLAMGWVSLASGEGGEEGEGDEAQVVAAAAVTFVASLLGVPLCARALAAGRKPAVVATSAAFLACWALKLCGGGWWLVAARACAGLGGAGAWCLAPLVAREMCEEAVRGAAVSALVVAHNLGFLLMYVAADLQLPHRAVLWGCLALSAAHCALFLFVPESPPFLAANGRFDEARASLAWLRGERADSAALDAELRELPSRHVPPAPLALVTDMLSEPRRRRAFVLCLVAVVGQEACGVLALLQFAERVFVLARGDAGGAGPEAGALVSPARHAVLLGAAQLVASALALYLVEKVGRKPLLVWCAVATGACLAAGAGAVWAGAGGAWAGAALAGAVFADSAGLQPAPYAMLGDMFHYQYRSCALALVGAAACGGNALEVVVFPLVARGAGLGAALALSAALTLALALFAARALPETRGRSPDQILDLICPPPPRCDSVRTDDCSKQTEATKM